MARILNTLFLLILIASGLALVWLGARLALIGGSQWYALTGAAMVATAILGYRRKRASIGLFWAFLAANLLWALWEVGLDGWALAPRLAMPVCLGLWMLTPWYRRHVGLAQPLPGGRLLWPGLAAAFLLWAGALFWIDRYPPPPIPPSVRGQRLPSRENGSLTAMIAADRAGRRYGRLHRPMSVPSRSPGHIAPARPRRAQWRRSRRTPSRSVTRSSSAQAITTLSRLMRKLGVRFGASARGSIIAASMAWSAAALHIMPCPARPGPAPHASTPPRSMPGYWPSMRLRVGLVLASATMARSTC